MLIFWHHYLSDFLFFLFLDFFPPLNAAITSFFFVDNNDCGKLFSLCTERDWASAKKHGGDDVMPMSVSFSHVYFSFIWSFTHSHSFTLRMAAVKKTFFCLPLFFMSIVCKFICPHRGKKRRNTHSFQWYVYLMVFILHYFLLLCLFYYLFFFLLYLRFSNICKTTFYLKVALTIQKSTQKYNFCVSVHELNLILSFA